MLTDADVKYWGPRPGITERVSSLIDANARVLEIGPGQMPFPRATHFVDWMPGTNVTQCDLSRERLPFADKEFDFVYCRHVLEDLYNPFFVCDEMSRVAKAGYVETPSPLAEIARGIDGGSPPWRGYSHHRYFVWEQDGVLMFAGKYPVLEHLNFDNEPSIYAALRGNPLLWNTYYIWKDVLSWRYLQHDVDYIVHKNYGAMLIKAINEGMTSAQEFEAEIGKTIAENVPSRRSGTDRT